MYRRGGFTEESEYRVNRGVSFYKVGAVLESWVRFARGDQFLKRCQAITLESFRKVWVFRRLGAEWRALGSSLALGLWRSSGGRSFVGGRRGARTSLGPKNPSRRFFDIRGEGVDEPKQAVSKRYLDSRRG